MLFNYEKNSNLTDLGILFLRITIGGLMLVRHGWPKLMKLLNDDPIKFADPFGTGPEIALALAVFAELLCALFIVFGFLTRASAIPLIITMLVAAFMIHGDDPFQKKEFAILYLIPFIFFLFSGGGRYAIDAMINKDKS